MQLFDENIKTAYKLGIVKNQPEEYAFITQNLKYELYDWQKDALENFLLNEKLRKFNKINTPNHLMFNMATGTGKTLLMAALILYYYHEGYKDFIFFVNQNAIVGKTQSNFIEKGHSKYLFAQNIIIDNKKVNIKEVEQFSNFDDDIQIKFTTINKLHNSIYCEKENEILLSELNKRDIVLIGDEAHHLNASTASKNTVVNAEFNDITMIGELGKNAKDEDIEKSWETTVIYYLLNKQNKFDNNKNVLLEFTATIPDDKNIQAKYEDKIIEKFTLPEFIREGYTKEINLVSSNGNKKQRILQALLFNWYRSRIALDYDIPNFKPVILFRSNEISESEKEYEAFLALIKNLKIVDFDFLKKISFTASEEAYKNGLCRLEKVRSYIKSNNISMGKIVAFLKNEFTEKTCIITNSKTNKTKTEKTDPDMDRDLNSLENSNNHIRAIFTVKRLTEGWDVLNLYDIVRLNEGRDVHVVGGKRKAGNSTTSEIQLIGRGVRYYPFKYKDFQQNKRKFDNDTTNDLRCLEELYFHSDNNERYISELSNELKREGFVNDYRTEKIFRFKNEFLESTKNMYLFANDYEKNPDRKLKTIPDDLEKELFEYKAETSAVYTERMVDFTKDKNDEHNQDRQLTAAIPEAWKTLELNFCDFDRHVVYKAIHILNSKKNSYFVFSSIKEKFSIETISDFFEKIKNMKINIICDSSIGFSDDSRNPLSQKEKLHCLILFFTKLGNELQEYDTPYVGTDFSLRPFKRCFVQERQNSPRLIDMSEEQKRTENQILESIIKRKEWYALDAFWGTDEERSLIRFIDEHYANLKKKYSDIKLVRNEEIFKIYDFDHGRGFMPDFILLLQKNDDQRYLQVFIEPKGEQLEEKDKWKNEFLKQITERYGVKKIIIKDFPNYRLVGLPFYNEKTKGLDKEFMEGFNEIENL